MMNTDLMRHKLPLITTILLLYILQGYITTTTTSKTASPEAMNKPENVSTEAESSSSSSAPAASLSNNDKQDPEETIRFRRRLKSPGILPSFPVPIGNVSAVVGRDVRLICTVDNLGQYQVAWLREESKTIISIDTNIIITNYRIFLIPDEEERKWVLHIKDVRESDRGFYQCQVNTSPMRSTSGYLEVVVPPKIVNSQSSQVVETLEQADVSLLCKAEGYPRPTIIWRRDDGAPIKLTGSTKQMSSITSLQYGRNPKSDTIIPELNEVKSDRLSLSNVDRTMAGIYVCSASNRIPPDAVHRIPLYVKLEPKTRLLLEGGSTHISLTLGDPLKLECLIEGFPKPQSHFSRLSSGSVSLNPQAPTPSMQPRRHQSGRWYPTTQADQQQRESHPLPRSSAFSMMAASSSALFERELETPTAANTNDGDNKEARAFASASLDDDDDDDLADLTAKNHHHNKQDHTNHHRRDQIQSKRDRHPSNPASQMEGVFQSPSSLPVFGVHQFLHNSRIRPRETASGQEDSGQSQSSLSSSKADPSSSSSSSSPSLADEQATLDTNDDQARSSQSSSWSSRSASSSSVSVKQTPVNPYTYRLELSIKRMKPEDFGKYSCIATNQMGASESHVIVTRINSDAEQQRQNSDYRYGRVDEDEQEYQRDSLSIASLPVQEQTTTSNPRRSNQINNSHNNNRPLYDDQYLQKIWARRNNGSSNQQRLKSKYVKNGAKTDNFQPDLSRLVTLSFVIVSIAWLFQI